MIPPAHQEPGKGKALMLALAVHLLLAVALFLGVQWKTEETVVEVELWSPVPRQATSLPPPPPPPREQPRPEPKPEPRVAPKSDPKPDPKPDIAGEEGRKKTRSRKKHGSPQRPEP